MRNIIYIVLIIITNILNFAISRSASEYRLLLKEKKALENKLTQSIPLKPPEVVNEISSFKKILKPHHQNTEDALLNVTQLALKHGFSISQYEVVTLDGYSLNLFRIPSKSGGRPVLLVHGLFFSADDWLTSGPESSLAYYLALAGFDVWLANTRGNKYSRSHSSLSPDDSDFWQFSFDEVGRLDLPALIDSVLSITNDTQLAYIGHSAGTTAFFVLCSELPEYNEKISIMIALAPMAFMSNVGSPIINWLAQYSESSWILNFFNYNELAPKNKNTIPALCAVGNGILCLTALFSVFGFDYEQVNRTNTASVLAHLPSGASLNQVVHFLQNVQSKKFNRFDYGPDKNEEIYGGPNPDEYPLENVSAPVALIYGDNDWLSNIEDILTLQKKLQKVVTLHRVPFKKFNHLDFLFAKDVKQLVYFKVLHILNQANQVY